MYVINKFDTEDDTCWNDTKFVSSARFAAKEPEINWDTILDPRWYDTIL